MPFVVDASVAVAWCLNEQNVLSDLALSRIADHDLAHAPVLFWFELHNAILVAIRRDRLTHARARSMLARVSAMSIVFDPLPDGDAILALATRHRLTFYDAVYLELAMREGMPLATLDNALAKAAVSEGVRLIAAP